MKIHYRVLFLNKRGNFGIKVIIMEVETYRGFFNSQDRSKERLFSWLALAAFTIGTAAILYNRIDSVGRTEGPVAVLDGRIVADDSRKSANRDDVTVR